MFVFTTVEADVLFHPVYPLVVWKLLRQVRRGSNLSPRQRRSCLSQRCLDRISEVFVSHHRFLLSRAIPIRTLALGANSRAAVATIAGYPFVTTPFTSIPHNCNWHSSHNLRSIYREPLYLSRLYFLTICLVRYTAWVARPAELREATQGRFQLTTDGFGLTRMRSATHSERESIMRC